MFDTPKLKHFCPGCSVPLSVPTNYRHSTGNLFKQETIVPTDYLKSCLFCNAVEWCSLSKAHGHTPTNTGETTIAHFVVTFPAKISVKQPTKPAIDAHFVVKFSAKTPATRQLVTKAWFSHDCTCVEN